jgi:hypothetical protein
MSESELQVMPALSVKLQYSCMMPALSLSSEVKLEGSSWPSQVSESQQLLSESKSM